MSTILCLYLCGCILFGTLFAALANSELETDPDDRHKARMQLVMLPLVWLLWPLVLAAGLVAYPVLAVQKVRGLYRQAFPKKG